MDSIALELIARWGLSGIMLIAAGYIIFDNWRRNKKNEDWYREHIHQEQGAIDTRSKIDQRLDSIQKHLNHISELSDRFREDIIRRVEQVEASITKHFPDHHQAEQIRMKAIMRIAPTVNSILANSLDDCDIDHVALGLLHNGTQSIAGIPYIKMGVIAEKYKPIKFPNDISLLEEYRDEDIVKYNKLPICIVQNRYISFDLNETIMSDMDMQTYSKCKSRGIKHIAFVALNDAKGLCTGCLIAYKFTDEPIDKDALVGKAKVLEDLYQDMLGSFEVKNLHD